MALRRLSAFVLLTACVTDPTESELSHEIIGGTQTTTTEFSTVVGLQQGGNNWFCTGVLVHQDWVLTSASCFAGVAGATQVRLDDGNLNDTGGRVVAVASLHIHPSFDINSATWIHDIALLKLAESISDRTPAALRRTAATPGTQVTQVGYGDNNNNGGGGGVLRTLTATTVDCAQANDSNVTNANVLCFDADAANAGSCYGDGGAPAFVGTGANRAVAGLASGSTGNTCTSDYDLYTSIATELPFIDGLIPASTMPPSPPPTDPTDPDAPSDPEGPGRDPTDPTTGADGPPIARGCSAGGHGGWLLAVLGMLALSAARRSGRRTA